MRTTRFMSFLFLFLSLSFFFLPEFRQGLQAPAFTTMQFNWLEQLPGEISAREVAGWARDAEAKKDARGLAFAALSHTNEKERTRLAQLAADLDKQWTWVLWNPPQPKGDPKLAEQLAARLQAWDPDNAIPYLYQGEQLFEAQNLGRFTGEQVTKLADQTDWRAAMAKAFVAPRYDAYTLRRFEFERTMLRESGWDRPVVAVYMVASMPIPSLLNARQYARLLVELGKQADAAGKSDEAAKHYWQVAHFGERMQLHGISLIEKLIGEALQQMSYVQLVPLLQKQGRGEEAVSLQFALDQLKVRNAIRRGQDPIAKSSNYNWTALLVFIFAAAVVVFGVFTLITVVYVNAKRWIRPQHKGRLYQWMTVAENYAPLLLFLTCLGLYICSFPFGQNFKHYMTASGEIHDLEPFFYNVFPAPFAVPFQNQLLLSNPFKPLAWYALGGLVLAVICSWVSGRRTNQSG